MMFLDCPAYGATESLTLASGDKHDLGIAGVAFGAERGTALDIARPNSAPAYYQGRAARLWLSAMRPPARTAPAAASGAVRRPGTRQAVRSSGL